MHNSNLIAALCVGLFLVTACAQLGQAQAPGADAPKPAKLINQGEGNDVAFPLHPTTRLASADQTASGLSLFEIVIPAGAAGAPPHQHTHEDEFFYVREGEVTFMADDQQKTLSDGGLALLPRGGWHAMWNDSAADAILLVGTSDGQFDDFFDAVAMEAAAAGNLSPPEVGVIVAKVGAERGITIDMSKVPNTVRPLYGMPPAE